MTVVPPAYWLSLPSTSVPAPSLIKAPVPPIRPCQSRLAPLATDIAPLPAPMVTPRALEKLADAASVPPSSVTAPAAAPRLASRETCTVPALTVVPPPYWLSPSSTSVPWPVLTSAP
ncbi:hypothetical protein L524_0286, partial [Bordetella bronchiseptica MBORD762]